jgi:hypothetical protein
MVPSPSWKAAITSRLGSYGDQIDGVAVDADMIEVGVG